MLLWVSYNFPLCHRCLHHHDLPAYLAREALAEAGPANVYARESRRYQISLLVEFEIQITGMRTVIRG